MEAFVLGLRPEVMGGVMIDQPTSLEKAIESAERHEIIAKAKSGVALAQLQASNTPSDQYRNRGYRFRQQSRQQAPQQGQAPQMEQPPAQPPPKLLNAVGRVPDRHIQRYDGPYKGPSDGQVSRPPDRFCEFHRQGSHSTSECPRTAGKKPLNSNRAASNR